MLRARVKTRIRRVRRWKRVSYVFVAFCALIFAGLTLDMNPFLLAGIALPLSIVAIIAGLVDGVQSSLEQSDTIEQLADVRLTGELIELLGIGRTPEHTLEILTDVLPQLKDSDAHLLNAQHRAILYRVISDKNRPMRNYGAHIHRYTEFTLAALKAFAQVGDASAIPHVQRLAETSTYQHIRKAAEECLTYLYARQENDRQSRSLLRASDASGGASEELLRAASGTAPPSEPAQLLRASAGSMDPPPLFPADPHRGREGGD
jgi:hypothetical protein